MLVLNLPLPPTVNHYLKSSGFRRYLSKAAIEFREQVSDYIAEYNVPKLGTARLEMQVTLFFATKRRQDIDNRIKALWDALAHAGVFDDDEQIDVLIIHRGVIKKGGGCLVMIDTLDAKHPLSQV